ncbi:MAG: RNase adapter RapZ [Acidimicrobiia bacterium]
MNVVNLVEQPKQFEVVIVTGMSGAGRTHAGNVLEDLEWFVIDNLPCSLIPKIGELAQDAAGHDRYALVVDIRAGRFIDELDPALRALEAMGANTRILFLDASDDVLVRRYEDTRRRHPLSEGTTLASGIAKERELLEDLRGVADVIIDTSELNVHQLRDRLIEAFSGGAGKLQVSVTSFGYKHGLPLDVDLVLDCRFLPNPHWVDSLRRLTGNDAAVREYVMAQPASQEFLDHLRPMLNMLLPAYAAEGKSYCSIAVGCTGGRHRSVVMTTEIASITAALGYPAQVRHRDVDRG